ncbi:MAG: peptidylprolyl isomerase [Hymenobacteraceae bacterium]|nr:peptidylprolyl isomerase [Hymenobacteraceae bacterium]
MRSTLPYLGAALVLAGVAGCGSSKPAADPKKAMSAVQNGPVIETLGTVPVYTSDFLYVYRKNNPTAQASTTGATPAADQEARPSTSLPEYLDLYTNFRLKVLDAEAHGLDTTTAFRRELDGYRQQLAQPYLTEKSVTDQLVKEAYDRMQQEVSAAHILILAGPEADPKDTLDAYNKITKIRQRVTSGGEDFGKVAAAESQDPSAKQNGGSLGYFSAMQMVYPFENAAYQTKPGEVSPILRTKFGYHILKVNTRRPAQGEIKVAHLMVRATPGLPKDDSVAAKKKVDEIYARVVKGEDWAKLVSQFSEDQGSSQQAGELPAFGTGRMIPSFEEAAFKLAKPGDIAPPVQTPYGWHIIKFLERKPLPPYAEMEQSLRTRVAKDSRSELNKAAFLKRVKAENQYQEVGATRKFVVEKADTALVSGHFTYTADNKNKLLAAPIFTLKGQPTTVTDYYAWLKINQRARPKGASPQYVMGLYVDQFTEQRLTDYEKANLETKYPEYRSLVREYRDGILLFQLMDEKVWSKAIEDTTGLKKFFADHKEEYKWGARVDATVISAADKKTLDKALALMKKGRYSTKRALPEPITFKENADTFAKMDSSLLDQLAIRMQQDTALTIKLIGGVDSREAANKKGGATLAPRRAKRAADYLIKKGGLAAKRVSTGTAAKATKEKDDAGRQAHRTLAFQLMTSDLTGLEETMNEASPLALQISTRKFAAGDSKVVDAAPQSVGTHVVEKDGRVNQVRVKALVPPGYKTLAEARGQATSDYQNYLEKQWIQELRAKYPVKVNQPEVDKVLASEKK